MSIFNFCCRYYFKRLAKPTIIKKKIILKHKFIYKNNFVDFCDQYCSKKDSTLIATVSTNLIYQYD